MNERTDSPAAKPRLLFYLAGLAMGGAEKHALDLRRRFTELGYPTDVIVHGRRNSPAVLRLPGAKNARILGFERMSNFAALPSVRSAFRALDADLVFCVNQSPTIWAMLLRWVGGLKGRIVCVFHTTLPAAEDRATLPLFRLAVRAADALVYVSANQQAYWRARGLGARRDLVVVNGVDLQRFRPHADARAQARDDLGLAPDDYVIGLLASFRPEKNHLELVEALDRLRVRGIPAKLVLVGGGPTRPDVEARVSALNLGDQVVFAGEFDDVRPVVAAFDAGVLCSNAVETFSLAALELLALGIPMVMTEIGGASEIVTPGVNGFLYPPGDLDALVEHLAKIADPQVKRKLQVAARTSVERYSVEAMLSRYVHLVNELVS